AFAQQCLDAATTAYEAAQANPDLLASPADGTGGGAYSDGDVSDEFYWAAAELYLTTGEQSYLDDLRASPHHTGDLFSATGFNWPRSRPGSRRPGGRRSKRPWWRPRNATWPPPRRRRTGCRYLVAGTTTSGGRTATSSTTRW